MSDQLLWLATFTSNVDDDSWTYGIFSSTEKAKEYVEKVCKHAIEWDYDDGMGRSVPVYYAHVNQDRGFIYVEAYIVDRDSAWSWQEKEHKAFELYNQAQSVTHDTL